MNKSMARSITTQFLVKGVLKSIPRSEKIFKKKKLETNLLKRSLMQKNLCLQARISKFVQVGTIGHPNV